MQRTLWIQSLRKEAVQVVMSHDNNPGMKGWEQSLRRWSGVAQKDVMRHALKKGLVGVVDWFVEVKEKMRLQDTWSLDNYILDKGVVFAGPPSAAPHRSFCIGVLFTETTVKIPPP